MIDITTWMQKFLHSLNETFANRVWFVGLQGSYARGEATDESDVDLLINKGEIKGLIDFVDFIHDLEQSLKCNVDVVTTSSHNKKFLEKICKDEVLIYGG